MATVQTGIATDLITFSRTSNATLTDSDGKIKWAPHNLLLASEQFDAASWTKSNCTVAANSIAAPNGTTTADTITLGAGTASKYVVQSLSSLGAQCVLACYVKIASGTVRYIQLLQNGDVQAYANFDITGNATGSKGTNTPSSTITSIGADWYYITATFTGAGNNLFIQVVDSASAAYSPATSATGTFHLWGASLYRSDLGGMKSNTSAYPMYNPTTVKNLLGYSEDFVSGWVAGGTTATANIAMSPNALQTADMLTPTVASGVHITQQSITVPATPVVLSFYVKAAGYSRVAIRENTTSGDYAGYLLSGAGSVLGSSSATGAISALSDGWYRISFLHTVASAGSKVYALYVMNDSYTGTAPHIYSYTGNGTSGVYLWGAQLSDSASLDAYVPNYGAAPTAAAYYGPRLDADPVTLAAKGLLVEELRANLAIRSAEFDNTAWGKNSLVTPITADVILAPTGTSVAETITAANATASHYLDQSTITWTAVVHTVSVYVKRGTQQFFQITCWDGTNTRYANFDILNGTPGTTLNATSTITPVGNGWYRATLTTSTAQVAASGNITFAFVNSTSASANINYAAAGTETFHLWGAQVEAGSFATSYIPTGAATATRNADVASVSTQAFPANNTEGSIVVAYDRIGIKRFSRLFTLGDAAGNYQVSGINYDVGNENSYIVAPTISSLKVAGLVPAVNTTNKLGFAFKSGDSAVSLNGAAAVDDTQVFTMVNDVLALGNTLASGQHLNGHIRQITYLPRRISNAELITRTS